MFFLGLLVGLVSGLLLARPRSRVQSGSDEFGEHVRKTYREVVRRIHDDH